MKTVFLVVLWYAGETVGRENGYFSTEAAAREQGNKDMETCGWEGARPVRFDIVQSIRPE